MRVHRLVGGEFPIPITLVASGDSRLGNGNEAPIGFTKEELVKLIWGVKSWNLTGDYNDGSGPAFTQDIVVNSPGAPIFLNNNWWQSGFGFFYPWLDAGTSLPQYSATDPYFDAQEKYVLLNQIAVLFNQTGITASSGMAVDVKTTDGLFAGGWTVYSLPNQIYFDGTLYYPVMNFTINPYSTRSGAGLTALGQLTVMGKTCDIFGGVFSTEAANFTAAVNEEW